MKCPACPASTLVMTDRSGIEIDYCPDCRGVWLDRGELDKIIERAAPTHPAPAAAVAPLPSPSAYPSPAAGPSAYPPPPPSRREWDDDDDDDDDDRRRYAAARGERYDERYDGRRKRKGLLGELFDF